MLNKLWTKVKQKNFLRQIKKNKHSRTSPDVQFKKNSLNKENTGPGTDYMFIGKTISDNQISKKNLKKKTENQCQNAACEQKTTSEKGKFDSNKIPGLEGTMNELVKPFRKKFCPKYWKTVKINVKLPLVNKNH